MEGLLAKVKSHLVEGNPFGSGDSATKHHSEEESAGAKFRAFMARLDDVVEGRVFPFTIKLQVRYTRVLTCVVARDARQHIQSRAFAYGLPICYRKQDPLGNSFIMWHGETPEEDTQLKTEDYERGWDEDEHLGLHDIQVGALSPYFNSLDERAYSR